MTDDWTCHDARWLDIDGVDDTIDIGPNTGNRRISRWVWAVADDAAKWEWKRYGEITAEE